MLTDRAFWESIGTTLLFSAVVVPSELIIGLILALLLADQIRFRTFYRTALIIPMVLAPVAVGIIFRLLYNNEFCSPNYLIKTFLHLPGPYCLGRSSRALS